MSAPVFLPWPTPFADEEIVILSVAAQPALRFDRGDGRAFADPSPLQTGDALVVRVVEVGTTDIHRITFAETLCHDFRPEGAARWRPSEARKAGRSAFRIEGSNLVNEITHGAMTGPTSYVLISADLALEVVVDDHIAPEVTLEGTADPATPDAADPFQRLAVTAPGGRKFIHRG